MAELSKKNSSSKKYLGAGNYDHFIPSAVKHIIGRSEFYTAYTPYQAEASQGTLQVIYEYQSLVCALTGMDAANASMYDGATALVEAAFLASRVTGRKKIAISSAVHPEYRKVLKTYSNGADHEIVEVPYNGKTGLTETASLSLKDCACFIISQPNFLAA